MNISFKIFLFVIIANIYLFGNQTDILLSTKELETLHQEGFIIKQDIKEKSGFIAFDVDKNIDIVFDEILNLKSYPKKIEDVSKVEIYDKTSNTTKAKIFISTFFIDFYDYVTHHIDKKHYVVTWTLDKKYKKENYFAKMNGYWKLKKISNTTTRVFYSNKLEFKSWIPDFVKNYLINKGLIKSTLWLRD